VPSKSSPIRVQNLLRMSKWNQKAWKTFITTDGLMQCIRSSTMMRYIFDVLFIYLFISLLTYLVYLVCHRCNTVITTVITVMCWWLLVRVVWRCVYSFHAWGVTLYTLRWGDPGSVDVFAQHSKCWMQTVLHIFLWSIKKCPIRWLIT